MARATDEVTLPAGKTLCEQGAIGREAFVIVERHRGGPPQQEEGGHHRARAPASGELALLDHKPRTASVIASHRPHGARDRRARVRRHRRRDPVDHPQADEVAGLEGPGARHPGLRLTVRGVRPRTTTFAAVKLKPHHAGDRGRRGVRHDHPRLGDHGHRSRSGTTTPTCSARCSGTSRACGSSSSTRCSPSSSSTGRCCSASGCATGSAARPTTARPPPRTPAAASRTSGPACTCRRCCAIPPPGSCTASSTSRS